MTNELFDSYPKQMLFHTINLAICAIRAPSDAALVLTSFTIILRLLMINQSINQSIKRELVIKYSYTHEL